MPFEDSAEAQHQWCGRLTPMVWMVNKYADQR